MALERFEQQQFGTAGVEGVNSATGSFVVFSLVLADHSFLEQEP